jgi:hypothetical protein
MQYWSVGVLLDRTQVLKIQHSKLLGLLTNSSYLSKIIPFMISEGFYKDLRVLCELEEPSFSMN